MRKPDVLALYRCCDCYVSLHRGEGFGRSIMESMALGLHVIVTGYSGNMDYASYDHVSRVDYRLMPLKAGEYFFAGQQSWADPDITHAATIMRQLVDANSLSVQNPIPVSAYAPKTLAADYKHRIESIYREFVA